MPCARCRSCGITCTYQRLGMYSPPSPSNIGDSHSSPVVGDTFTGGSTGDAGKIHVQYLLNYTDPHCTFGTFAAVAADHSAHLSAETVAYPSPDVCEVNDAVVSGMSFWDQGDGLLNTIDVFSAGIGGEFHSTQHYPLSQPHEEYILQYRMSEIVSQLSNIQSSVSRDRVHGSECFNGQLAESVFTVTNLNRFVWAYFSRCDGYIPIIHQPIFDCEHASLPLVLALFLFGSLLSAPYDPAISARCFFDLAEEYIFTHPTFIKLLERDQGNEISVEDIEILQAALIILVVQIGKNDVMTQRRIRLKRHPCLVAAVRLSKLFGTCHQPLVHDVSRTDWLDFVSIETRVRQGHLSVVLYVNSS